jgi:hypothetical protein
LPDREDDPAADPAKKLPKLGTLAGMGVVVDPDWNRKPQTDEELAARPLKTGALGGCLQWQRLLLGTGPELRVRGCKTDCVNGHRER